MAREDDELTRGRLQAVMDQVSDRPLSHRLCIAAPAVIGVDGAAVSLVPGESGGLLLVASDAAAAALTELQLDLGVGPSVDASTRHRRVTVEDVAAHLDPTMGIYLDRVALVSPVRAMFSFPIGMGAITIGALDLFNERPGALSDEAAAAAVMVADLLALAVLAEQAGVEADDGELAWLAEAPGGRMQVHQATGRLMVQLDCGPEAALARLRAYAFAHDEGLTDVARAVLEGRLRMHP